MPEFLYFSEKAAAKIRKKLEKRFSERTLEGCCIRPGSKGKKGYPTLTWGGVTHGAHRVSYAVWKKPVPVKWNVCHLCSNTQCVNPSHLVLGTGGQNSDDNLRKTRDQPRPTGQRGRLAEQICDPQGLEWPPPGPPTPSEAMAFPASADPPTRSPNPPDLESLRRAFPASYPEE